MHQLSRIKICNLIGRFVTVFLAFSIFVFGVIEYFEAIEADKLGENFPVLFYSFVMNILEGVHDFTNIIRRLKSK